MFEEIVFIMGHNLFRNKIHSVFGISANEWK